MINNVNIAKLNSNGLTTENLVSHKPKFDKSVFYNSTSSFIIPKDPGVYFITDFRGVLYIGETQNLRQRFVQHMFKEKNVSLKIAVGNPCGEVKFHWFVTSNKFKALKLQKDWIRLFNPICNNIKYKKNKEEICQLYQQ